MQRLKSEKGFSAMDGTIALIIVALALGLIATLVYNTYIQALSTHKNSMATFYAVEVLEKANKMEYYDVYLQQGTKTTSESILDIPVDSNYTITLDIKDYNKLPGNEEKKDLIKILEVTVKYDDNDVEKNITLKTLKYNR